jgi:Protein of unknown function (DUF3551)
MLRCESPELALKRATPRRPLEDCQIVTCSRLFLALSVMNSARNVLSRRGITMRTGACTIVGIWAILIAAPVWAAGGRYGTDYPVCMEALDAGGGTHFECSFTSIEQCRVGTTGTPGTCFKNPSYVPRPADAVPAAAEPEPARDPKRSLGRYGTDYPVCMEALDAGGGGTHFDCSYTSIEQCKVGATGTPGSCFKNPSYVPRPGDAAPAAAEPAPDLKKDAGRYGTDYPVCMEALDAGGGSHFECSFTSLEQCRVGATGTPGTCFKNPSYVPPPPEPVAVQADSAPPAKPGKPAKQTKSAKSAKSVQSPQSPPSPQPVQSR